MKMLTITLTFLLVSLTGCKTNNEIYEDNKAICDDNGGLVTMQSYRGSTNGVRLFFCRDKTVKWGN